MTAHIRPDRHTASVPSHSGEDRLAVLVRSAKDDLHAAEVWLFGSRARGDHHPDSDWDIFLIFEDDADGPLDDPVAMWRIGREAGLYADVVGARRSEMHDGDMTGTLAQSLFRDGIRLDVN